MKIWNQLYNNINRATFMQEDVEIMRIKYEEDMVDPWLLISD
jgi:hypothetical protein